jgi:CrcB protein
MPSSPRTNPRAVLAVAIGGCIGGPLRYAAAQLFPDQPGEIPWAIFVVNVMGAALLGLLLVLVLESGWSRPYVREFAGVGVLGSFTTFSTWMLQSENLIEESHPQLAVAYLAGSLIVGLLAAIAGLTLGRSIITSRRRI